MPDDADTPQENPPRRRRDEDDDYDRLPRRSREDYDDDYRRDRPRGDATGGLIPYKNAKALTAYYTGVFGLISCFLCLGIFGIVPIIFGILGLKHAKRYPESKGQGHAITGIVLGCLELLSFLGTLVFAAFTMYTGRR